MTDTPAPVKKKRSTKGYTLLGFVVAGGLALLSWTQTWVDVDFTMPTGAPRSLEVVGSVAAPALSALALCLLALVAALSLAGRVFRLILGAVGVLLAGAILATTLGAMADPTGAAEPAITTASGVAGHEAVRALVDTSATTFWPLFAIAGAVVAILMSVLVFVTSGSWSGGSRRYSTGSAPVAKVARERDDVDNWDDLSRGDDPTAS